MKAISPVLPHSPQYGEVVYAKDQPQYLQLPAVQVFYDGCGTQSAITCYKLTLRERLQVLITGRVWFEQMHFGQKLQPQRPSVYEPLKPKARKEVCM